MTEENGGGQDQSTGGWDSISGPSQTKAPPAWDSIVADPNPQSETIGFMVGQGEKQDPERAASVVRLAGKYKFPEQFVDRNFDKIKEQDQQKAFDSEDLINTNPALAKMIAESGPAFASVALKHLPNLQKLNMLYTRTPALWPLSDEAVQQDAHKIAKLRAARDWENYGKSEAATSSALGGYDEFGNQQVFHSQQEMEAKYYQQELDKRRNIESIVGGTQKMGALESLKARFPQDSMMSNLVGLIPGLSHAIPVADKLELKKAKEAMQAGTADEIQKDLILHDARLQAAVQLRGKSFLGRVGEQAAGLSSVVGEMMIGGTIGRAASGVLGLGAEGAGIGQKLLTAFVESSAGAAAAGLPSAAETFVQDATPKGALGMDDKGNVVYKVSDQAGNPMYVSIKNAALSSFADYFSAHLFGPWFAKASPEIQMAAKQSLMKAFPVEAFKMVGMNEASAFIKGIGGATSLEAPAIIRAFSDPEVAKDVAAQALIGGLLGTFHAAGRNAEINSYHDALKTFIDGQAREAQLTQEAALRRAGLLHESKLSEDIPAKSMELSQEMARGGPNEFTYLPVKTFGEYWAGKGLDARSEALKLVDPQHYDNSVRTGADLTVKTAIYDHVIGRDPEASKFFGNELRGAPDAEGNSPMNLREARDWQKRLAERQAAPSTVREDIIQQIVDQARAKNAKESVMRARLDQGSENLLRDPAILGLNDQQVSRISKVIGAGQAKAEETINAKEAARRDRLKGDLYAKEEARVREQITKEVDARPEQMALAGLKNGTIRGEPWPADRGAPPKISKEALKQDFPGVKLSDLPRGVTNTEASDGVGLHPDVLAEMHGYNSGHDLLYALLGADRTKAIDEATKAHMDAKYPSILDPSTLPGEAIKALHNEHSAELKQLVLQYIVENKLLPTMMGVASRKPPTVREVRDQAERDVASRPIGQMDPQRYLEAEKKEARDAMTAAAKGDWEAVFDAKLRELHAHENYRASVDAQERGQKILSGWGDLPDNATLQKAANVEWRQQIMDFLRKIGVIAVDPHEMIGKKPFAEWALAKLEAGDTRLEPIYVDPKFIADGFTAHYEDLPYRDILSLNDTISQMKHLATDADKIQTSARKIALESWVQDATDSIAHEYEKLPLKGFTKNPDTWLDKLKAKARGFDAANDRPEEFFTRLDGGRIDGPFAEALMYQASQCQTKAMDLRTKFVKAIQTARTEMTKDIEKHLYDRVTVPGVERPLTLRDILGIALNGMNESNYSKMTRGELLREKGLTEEQMQAAVGMLTKEHKDYVQSVVDALEGFSEESDSLQKWATGLPLKKLQPKVMWKAMEGYKGGYYPMMYDRGEPAGRGVGEMQIAGDLGKLLEPSYRRATTDGGYREGRIEEFAAPVDLDIDRLATHVDSMIQDLAYRRWLVDANKVVSNPDLRTALRDHLGKEYMDVPRNWLKRAVNGFDHASDQSLASYRGLMGAMRYNATIVAIAGKASVFLHHALGIGPAIAEVGLSDFSKGVGEFLSKPRETYAQVMAESGEMRHYLETADTNVHENLAKLGNRTDRIAQIQRTLHYTVSWGNMLRALPTYLGAKAKAMRDLAAQGKSGPELTDLAIRSAERAVRVTSGAGAGKDVPAIMSQDAQFMRMITMFHTPGSILYSRLRTMGHEVAKTGDISKFLIQGFWVLGASATLHQLTGGRMPDETKDEGWAEWWAKNQMAYPFSSVPLGHEIASPLIDMAFGHKPQDINVTPAFQGLTESVKTLEALGGAVSGDEEWDKFVKQAVKTSGYYIGAPTGQLEITGGYLYDLLHGTANPNDILEFSHDLLFTRPKERR